MNIFRFNRLTQDERMEQWRAQYEWHRWFAWRPVLVDHVGLVWLEELERRYVSGYGGGWYEFRRAIVG